MVKKLQRKRLPQKKFERMNCVEKTYKALLLLTTKTKTFIIIINLEGVFKDKHSKMLKYVEDFN
jgi:hypothetical protein